MTRIIHLIIVLLELRAFSISLTRRGIKKNFVYYTQISNLITLISSLLFVILGEPYFVVVLRYLSECMLVMTFIVTVFYLVPVSGDAKGLLFSGSGLYHHLIVPVISTLSYMFIEKRAGIYRAWLPVAFTLGYGLVMLYLNYRGRVEGPYPFFIIKRMGAKRTAIWMVCLLVFMSVISLLVGCR